VFTEDPVYVPSASVAVDADVLDPAVDSLGVLVAVGVVDALGVLVAVDEPDVAAAAEPTAVVAPSDATTASPSEVR